MAEPYLDLVDLFLDACDALSDVYKEANNILAKQAFEDNSEGKKIHKLRKTVCAMLEKSSSF